MLLGANGQEQDRAVESHASLGNYLFNPVEVARQPVRPTNVHDLTVVQGCPPLPCDTSRAAQRASQGSCGSVNAALSSVSERYVAQVTLIVGVKVPEGIAVAADSRVTEHPSNMSGVIVAADDAVKMRRIPKVGSMWIAFHGNLSIGGINARAMLDGFAPSDTLSGKDVADEIHKFYLKEWNRVGSQPPAREEDCLGFHVYGASPSDSTPAVVKGIVPGSVTPLLDDKPGIFMAGETEFVERLVYGMAPRFTFPLPEKNIESIIEQGTLIRYEDLPLEEARALAVFLVETTAQMHLWTHPHRNNGSTVGGPVQVVTIRIPDLR